jgi:hypothetical protein
VKALIDHQPQARGRVRGVLDLAQPDLHEVPVIDQDMPNGDQDRDGERPEQAAIDGDPDECRDEGQCVGRHVAQERAATLEGAETLDLGDGLPLRLQQQVSGQMADQKGRQDPGQVIDGSDRPWES